MAAELYLHLHQIWLYCHPLNALKLHLQLFHQLQLLLYSKHPVCSSMWHITQIHTAANTSDMRITNIKLSLYWYNQSFAHRSTVSAPTVFIQTLAAMQQQTRHCSQYTRTDARTHAHTHPHTQMFNSLFSMTTWVGGYQKDKPFWILLKQETMEWQWHQLNHMQIICTSLQTDNHASAPSLHTFLQAGCPSWRPTNSVKAWKAISSSKFETSHL